MEFHSTFLDHPQNAQFNYEFQQAAADAGENFPYDKTNNPPIPSDQTIFYDKGYLDVFLTHKPLAKTNGIKWEDVEDEAVFYNKKDWQRDGWQPRRSKF